MSILLTTIVAIHFLFLFAAKASTHDGAHVPIESLNPIPSHWEIRVDSVNTLPQVVYSNQSFELNLVGKGLDTSGPNRSYHLPHLHSTSIDEISKSIIINYWQDNSQCILPLDPVPEPSENMYHQKVHIPALTAGVYDITVNYVYACDLLATISSQIEIFDAPTGENLRLNGNLENPPVGSVVSGIGLISGWACYNNYNRQEVGQVSVSIDGAEPVPASYGTSRGDTSSVCDWNDDGKIYSGFGLLINWNLLGPGEHEIKVYADGIEFGTSTFRVNTLGQEFVRGLSGEFNLPGFPTAEQSTKIEWLEALQNFVIAD